MIMQCFQPYLTIQYYVEIIERSIPFNPSVVKRPEEEQSKSAYQVFKKRFQETFGTICLDIQFGRADLVKERTFLTAWL